MYCFIILFAFRCLNLSNVLEDLNPIFNNYKDKSKSKSKNFYLYIINVFQYLCHFSGLLTWITKEITVNI